MCDSSLTGQKQLYCSNACSIRSWKLRDRAAYLESKRRYRQKHKDKIYEYAKKIKNEFGIGDKLYKKIKNVLLRDAVCLRCGTTSGLNIHHIRPLRLGGNSHLSNLTTLCFQCHMQWHKMFEDEYWDNTPSMPPSDTNHVEPIIITKIEKVIVEKVRKRKKVLHPNVMFSTDPDGNPLAYTNN